MKGLALVMVMFKCAMYLLNTATTSGCRSKLYEQTTS